MAGLELRDKAPLPSRKRTVNTVYDIYSVILGQRIWSLDEHLAKPLVEILCGRNTEEELLDLIRSEDQVLQAELVLAKAVYKAHLQRNRLIAVELDLPNNQHQYSASHKTAVEHSDHAVRTLYQIACKRVSDEKRWSTIGSYEEALCTPMILLLWPF